MAGQLLDDNGAWLALGLAGALAAAGAVARGSFARKREPWITHEGKLGGKGFLTRPYDEQTAILDDCLPEWGYRSCLGSVMVLERNRAIQAKYGRVLQRLRRYLVDTYGGAGADERWPSRRQRSAA